MENDARFSEFLTFLSVTSENLEMIFENISRQTFLNNVQDGSIFWMKCTNFLCTGSIDNDLSSLKFCSHCVCIFLYTSFKCFFDPLNFLHRDIFVSNCFLLTPSYSIFRFIHCGIYCPLFLRKTFFFLLEDPLGDSSYDDILDASSLLDSSEKLSLFPSDC